MGNLTNELQVFNNAEFGSVRTITVEGEPFFVAKDVAEILGYSNPRKAIADHVDEEDKGGTKCDTLGGKQELTVINESGLYSLILSSKMPNAKKFKRWGTFEVLPTIRRHGLYAMDEVLANPDILINALLELKAECERVANLEAVIAVQNQQMVEMQPKVSYYDVVLNCADLIVKDTMIRWCMKHLPTWRKNSVRPLRLSLLLIIPMTRDISKEEYPAVARMVAKELGIDLFNDTTYQPHRLMYWPSISMNGDFIYKVLDGEVLNPDDYLDMYDDWHDISTHPTSSKQSAPMKKDVKSQADPLAKSGIVGAFCRTYGIRDAIDIFLKEVYEPFVMEGRYDYIPADSSAGVTIHDEKFSYSFHATDPICGMLRNAFDVVRVHLFSDEDEKKSFEAMAEFARNDEKVKLTLFEERQQKEAVDFDEEDPDSWKK